MNKWLQVTLAFLFSMNTMTIYAKACVWNGIPLYGKVQFVTAFPDIKIQYVSAFPDISVEFVTNFSTKCGQWEVVESFPNFKVQIVNSFPDLTVKLVIYNNFFPKFFIRYNLWSIVHYFY